MPTTQVFTATVKDAQNAPVQGATVNFASDDPSVTTVSPASAVTNAQGQASTTATKVAAGTAHVTASCNAHQAVSNVAVQAAGGYTQLLTDLGLAGDVGGIFDVRFGRTVNGSSQLTALADARGAAGYAAALAALDAGHRFTLAGADDATYELVPSAGNTPSMKGPVEVGRYSLNGPWTMFFVGNCGGGVNFLNLLSVGAADASVSKAIMLHNPVAANASWAGWWTDASPYGVYSGVPGDATKRRLVILSRQANGDLTIDVPGHARQTLAGAGPKVGDNLLALNCLPDGTAGSTTVKARAAAFLPGLACSPANVTTIKNFMVTNHAIDLAA